MKVLVIDSPANSNTAFIFEICTQLLQDPEIQARFCKHSEDAIDYAQWFQPDVILFTGKLRGEEGESLIDTLHEIAPLAMILYLEKNQIYVHGSTFREPGTPRWWTSGRPATSLHDLAIAVAGSPPSPA